MPLSREQERERKRAYRARQRGVDVPRSGTVQRAGESVEDAVRRELDSLPASDSMAAAAAGALAMARLLDDPKATPQHPAAAAQLRMTMDGLRAARVAGGPSALTLIRGGRSAS